MNDAPPQVALGGEVGLLRYAPFVSSGVYAGLTWLSADNAYLLSLGGRGSFMFLGADVSPLLAIREGEAQLGARLRGLVGPAFVSVSAWRTPFGHAEPWTGVVQVGGGLGHLFSFRKTEEADGRQARN